MVHVYYSAHISDYKTIVTFHYNVYIKMQRLIPVKSLMNDIITLPPSCVHGNETCNILKYYSAFLFTVNF
jgi:hypothetical protein